jgi:ADP-ribose pyrophosphatase YjhB (NUDIX family)/ASC-1-like (ASCH) protein
LLTLVGCSVCQYAYIVALLFLRHMAEQKLHVCLNELQAISTNTQRVIVQLFDQRRKKLVVGDTLLLIEKEKRLQQVSVALAGTRRFASFAELFAHYGPKALGCSPKTSGDSFVAELHKTYYHKDEERLGVIALELAKERSRSVLWQDPQNGKVLFTLVDHLEYKKLFPVKQSYGFCFNDAGQLLIGRAKSSYKGRWVLPGGTIEPGEDAVKALHRELDEEVSITVFKPTLVGIQQVDFLEKDEDTVYQLRFAARIKKIKELTPDPDTGEVWERKFIEPEEFQKYISWGVVGQVFLDRAVAWFTQEQKKKKRK